MKTLLKSLERSSAIAILSTMVLSFAIPPVPASANPFSDCVNSLLNEGVSGEIAGEACADALIPREYAKCVSIILGSTDITAEQAVTSCYQVRRPVDLGNCVVDIQNATLEESPSQTTEPVSNPPEIVNTEGEAPTPIIIALNSCRQSLLPGRYSECVIALSRKVEQMTPIAAMNTCLSAEDFPRDLFPAYNQ